MRHPITILIAVLSLSLTGCSKPEPPKTRLDPHETIFKEQIKALDKAKTVEGTVEQDAQHTRDAVDKADAAAR